MESVLLTAVSTPQGGDESFDVYARGVHTGEEYPGSVTDAWEIQVDTKMPPALKQKFDKWFKSTEAQMVASSVIYTNPGEWKVLSPLHLSGMQDRVASSVEDQISKIANPLEWIWDENGDPGEPLIRLERMEAYMHTENPAAYYPANGGNWNFGWGNKDDFHNWNRHAPFGVLILSDTDDDVYEVTAAGDLVMTSSASEPALYPFQSFTEAVQKTAAALAANPRLI